MAGVFEPMSEEEFYREVDKGIEQADNGQLQDAREAMGEITRELKMKSSKWADMPIMKLRRC